ncbi:MAG: S9 family peptidase [Bacteroidota bacterium]
MKKIFVVLFCFSALLLSQKRPFTIADLYKIKSIASPQYSPDGKRIVFTMTESFLKEGKTNSEVFLMNADGSGQRKLTSNPAADYAPHWSPDGKVIYFLSTRKNGAQLWKLSLDGGEPEQLTNLSTGVDNVKLSPDGKGFVFSTDVYPEFGADDAMNKKTDEAKENGPLQAHMADQLLYRHWTSWADGKRTHSFYYTFGLKSYVDLTPGNYDAPGFGMSAAEISPDGNEICFTSNHDKVEATSTNKDLFLIPASGGEAKNITQANLAYDGEPVYSPNGKYIAFKTQTIAGYEADLFRIALYDRTTGKIEMITEGKFDNWVESCCWSADSKTLYFTAQVKGNVPLYTIDVKSKSITQVLNAQTIDAFDVAPDGKSLIYTRRSIGEPVELWKASLEKGVAKNPVRLTTFNKSIEDSVDIRPAEELWIQSPTGKKIHTFLVKPHNFDPKKKYPLILNVHGGPQSQWADAFRGDWQVYPGSGYIVALPNPHGSTGYGQEFTAAISKDWGGKVYQDVMAVADSLSHISYVDPNRMGAMGWSYGGYMMMWLEGHTDRFKAIASMMGVYDLRAMHGTTEELWFPEWDLNGAPYDNPMYQQWSPNNFVKNFKTPCLVITGERDYRVSYNQSLEFFTDLQKMDVPSRLIVFPNDGHWPSNVKSMPLYYNAHLDWFHKYLGGEPAPYDMTKMIRNQAFE